MGEASDSREYMFFKRLMRQSCKPGNDMPADFTCKGCKDHRPHWDYRFCVHTECPMMKGFMTFREEFYEDGGENDAGI